MHVLLHFVYNSFTGDNVFAALRMLHASRIAASVFVSMLNHIFSVCFDPVNNIFDNTNQIIFGVT